MTINENFVFRIPDRFEELEDRENFPNFYSVDCSSVRHPAELSSRIVEADSCFKNRGPDFILETFDYFYFVIKYFKEIDQDVKKDAWVLLNRSMLSLYSKLNEFINESFQLDQRRIYQNKLQMTVYAFVLLSELYEEESGNAIADIEDVRNHNQKKKSKSLKLSSKVYQESKHQSISTMLQLFSLRLDRVFDTPHFLTNFINITTRWIYKIIENSMAFRLRSSVYFQNMCEIITIALDKYQHGINYCMKIIELLQNKESSLHILSDLVAYNIKQLPHLFIINDIIDQIKSIDINILSRDSSGPRALSSFLVELGQKCTDQMFKHISDLFEFLEQDSYLLRNATLEIISIIIIKKFKSPSIVKDVHIKNKLLEKLEEHIHDMTSYTRSRVLNLWCNLAQNGAISIERLPSVVDLIIGRLEDKSCFVRKNALHFLTLMLKENPFNMMNKKDMIKAMEKTQAISDQYKQQLHELIDRQDAINQEMLNLNIGHISVDSASTNTDPSNDTLPNGDMIIDVNNEAIIQQESKKRKSEGYADLFRKRHKKDMEYIQNLATTWVSLEKPFHDFWKRVGPEIKDKLYQNLSFPEELPEDDIEKGFEYFRNLVLESQFEQALVALFSLKSLYPNERVFQLKESDCRDVIDGNDEDDLPMTDVNDGSSNQQDSLAKQYFNDLDGLFVSAMTNFSSKFRAKLSYELTLAKLVFLAPLINFGNLNIEPDEHPNESQKQILTEIMSQDALSQNIQTIERGINKVKQFETLIERLKLAIHVTDAISKSIPVICTLLNSRNVTDIQEAISFFTYAYKMEIDNALLGVQKMLKLIFTKEKTIRDALLEAFTEVYLNYSPTQEVEEDEVHNNKRFHYLEVKHLSNMILKLNQGELVCAETLIKELYQAQKFNQIHLQILWERYAMKYGNLTEEDSRAALIIIGMLASAQPSLIRNECNLHNIINISLEARYHDYRLVADTCEVLLKAFQLPQTDLLEKFFKLPQNHLLFERLHLILVNSITNIENKYWLRMSSAIVKVIYFLAEKPDMIISKMIQECYLKIIEKAQIHSNHESQNDQLSSQNHDDMPECQEVGKKLVMVGRVDDVMLSHFISMLGDVAVNLLIHLDLHLMKELKIRQYNKDKLRKDDKLLKNSSNSRLKRTSGSRNSLIGLGDDDDDDLNDMIGPNSNEDPYQENILKICNEAVLFDKGILSKFTSLVERIASDYDGRRYSYCLRQSSSLTMAKFMVLSLNYTRKNRAILADILEKSKDGDIRSNAIISFGDLLVRFPNEIEHFTGKIFECLVDKNFQVKSNALKVLTRLILADMIKPKGHISKIAQLITDDDQFISSSARLFFVELGKKNNVYIYNYLPDIISNLSGTNGMQENKFQEMIKFLFELLEKIRNTESLVTKLCHRFSNTTDERIWRDLSFCLSQLQYNDRAMINLMTNFSCFANTFYCDSIYDNISSIINNTRKAGTLKQETKVLLDEMESRMKQIRTKGTTNSENDNGEVMNDVINHQEQNNDTNSTIRQSVLQTQEESMELPDLPLSNKRSTRTRQQSPLFTTISKKRQHQRMTNRKELTTKKMASITSNTKVKKEKRSRRRIICNDDNDSDEYQNNDDNEYDFNE